MDEDNEKLCAHGGQEDKHILKGELALHTTTGKLHLKITTSLVKSAPETGEKVVLDVLKQKGLLDQRLAAEFAKVEVNSQPVNFHVGLASCRNSVHATYNFPLQSQLYLNKAPCCPTGLLMCVQLST